MNSKTIIKQDWFFYTALFFVFAGVLFFVHKSYVYTAKAPSGVPISASDSPSYKVKELQQTVQMLFSQYNTNKDVLQKAKMAEQMADAQYQVYTYTHQKTAIDSAALFADIAYKGSKGNTSIIMLSAKIAADRGDFSGAQAFYEKAITLSPKDATLYQVLGTLFLFRTKEPQKAKPYFEKALQCNPQFPGVNYCLGQIALSANNSATAVEYFEKELAIFSTASDQQKQTQQDLVTAALFSSMQLSYLYSTAMVDGKKAQDRFNLYMSLETDPQRKQQTAQQIQGYWDQRSKGSVSR